MVSPRPKKATESRSTAGNSSPPTQPQQPQQPQQSQQPPPPPPPPPLEHQYHFSFVNHTSTRNSDPPLIYSAPTVDTLGDESAIPLVPTESQLVTTKDRQKTTNRTYSSSKWKEHTRKGVKTSKTTGRTSTTTTTIHTSSFPLAGLGQPSKASSIPRQPPPEFQRQDDYMTVSIRSIPVAERSAFALNPAPSIHAILNTPNSNNNKHHWKKLSPSPQHLYWIHKLQNMDHIRQLAFSPSMGSTSDILYPGDHLNTAITTPTTPTTTNMVPSSDGRYRSIDPVQATLSALPTNPPLLSNKRHRLPTRADVGFPNATAQEIQQKQQEINQETEWEEASPRLIVLVTSDDLGTAAVDPSSVSSSSSATSSSSSMSVLHSSLLIAMPYAGKELVEAKWKNQQHFQAKKSTTTTTTTTTQSKHTSTSNTQPPPQTANRYSVLAPPLDATYSSTVGWRPRPFHDRPPGIRYTLVSPIQLDFAIGTIEPLVCSLTLYSLCGTTTTTTTSTRNYKDGKTSEDFFFPAGNWKGKLKLDPLVQGDNNNNNNNNNNQSVIEHWLKRKHKALFALDPLIVPNKEQLYVVLKVFAVTHLELATAYLLGNSAKENNTTNNNNSANLDENASEAGYSSSSTTQDQNQWKNRIKTQFPNTKTPEACAQRAAYRSSNVFESFGTQFLSPLCFGVTPLRCPLKSSNAASSTLDDDYRWPVGQVHNEMMLHAFPSNSESHADFVQRLYSVITEPGNSDASAPSTIGNATTMAAPIVSTVSNAADTPQKRKGLGRFMTPKKGTKKDLDDQSAASRSIATTTRVEPTPTIPGKVALYIADMDVDFLESLLQTPTDLEDVGFADRTSEKKVLPKLLADVSGTCGIMMDPTKSLNDTKRSNLVRLPPSETGYMDACDFREVWFLPPMIPKHHHLDPTPSYRSLVNLLYIYPRHLRHSGVSETILRKGSKNQLTHYTVMVSLVESVADKQESGMVEAQTKRLRNFHNPAPWAGPSYVKSVYTKIPVDGNSSEDLKDGIPLQDEFKMQLPAVLDGNHFLRFTLCLVELSDDLDDASSTDNASSEDSCALRVRRLVETTVPLSSYVTRDPVSGTKVATIIPNRVHRLKLGDFQLQVETRLFSSIHVTDPSLATALREFPIAFGSDSTAHGATELALLSKDKSGSTEKVMFAALFASADPSSLLCHFRTILFMHLASLVKEKQSSTSASEKFLSGCMDSLLEVCERARAVLLQNDDADDVRLQAFTKAILDAYDETYFHSSGSQDATCDDDDSSEVARVELGNVGDSRQEEEAEGFDGGAIRRRKKAAFRSEIDTRISRTFSAMESPSSTTFLRTAYGATKTDRMRLEAELGATTSRYTHLVDDDETVVTFATVYSGDGRMAEAREAFERVKTPRPNDNGKSSVMDAEGIGGVPIQDFLMKSLSETALAQRVRSAAKVMLAPCVPQNFFNPNPKAMNSVAEEKHTAGDSSLRPDGDEDEDLAESKMDKRVIALAGSDVEDEGVHSQTALVSHLVQGGAAFRSPHICPILHFSVKFDASNPNAFIPLARAEFVYESLLLLWLRSISDFAASKGFSRGSRFNLTASTGDASEGAAFQKFYDNMDLLLPLCLKSIALRFGLVTKKSISSAARVIIDTEHIAIFESFFETVPLLLLREAISDHHSETKDLIFQNVLIKSEYIIDFLIALYAIFHPAHTSVLTNKFFQSLRYAETEGFDVENGEVRFEWSDENLYRVKCSRQLRLRAVEKLAVLPNFIALNYPMRFPMRKLPPKGKKASWKAQHKEGVTDSPLKSQDLLQEEEKGFPPSGWLAEILTKEALSISALSCEAVVAEAMAHAEEHQQKSSSSRAPNIKRPTAAMTREDLLMFQSVAIHAITCVHELLLRRHAMDRRFQKDSTRSRIASLFALPIFGKSLASVRWLARMESTHRVRSLWLLCFTYILQEAPENLIREAVSTYSNSRETQIHRFVRLLRLSSSTFQSFIDQQRYCMFPSEIDSSISPWLLQESFNTICATTIIVVEECAGPNATKASDQKRLIQGVLDLLLHMLTTPQSTVTHLRAVGGAIQALEGFGAAMFMETTGPSLQHWIRVILGLMNSIALSVRSIAVDFVVSLLGSSFDLYGSIDELAIIFATVLPEVAAREIGLCSVSGHIMSLGDAERAVWPLRRSLADLEDANPVDDTRVDLQLSPGLSVFCRACQAILDGVLIELRLEGTECDIVGSPVKPNAPETYTFDADEESLFEAANFFLPESAPIQRIRWLLTLKTLHMAKGQWLEAAETLILCSRAIADAIPHLSNVWRPSRFPLWSDSRRSLWLSTVGEDLGIPERGNDQVMSFADKFLEPALLGQLTGTSGESEKLKQPTVSLMCNTLTTLTREAVAMYEEEGGLDELTYSRLEALLMVLMEVLEDHGSRAVHPGIRPKRLGILDRRRHVEDEASLRKVIASISGYMTKLTERMLLVEVASPISRLRSSIPTSRENFFIRVLLSGQKPSRFTESTTLPAFVEWNTPCICRVPKAIVEKALQTAGHNPERLEEAVCSAFVKPIRNALLHHGVAQGSIVFRLGNQSPSESDQGTMVFVDLGFVQMTTSGVGSDRAIALGNDRGVGLASPPQNRDDHGVFSFDGRNLPSKHFLYRKPPNASQVISSTFVEVTVAQPFPCPLSRQRSLLTSEFGSHR